MVLGSMMNSMKEAVGRQGTPVVAVAPRNCSKETFKAFHFKEALKLAVESDHIREIKKPKDVYDTPSVLPVIGGDAFSREEFMAAVACREHKHAGVREDDQSEKDCILSMKQAARWEGHSDEEPLALAAGHIHIVTGQRGNTVRREGYDIHPEWRAALARAEEKLKKAGYEQAKDLSKKFEDESYPDPARIAERNMRYC